MISSFPMRIAYEPQSNLPVYHSIRIIVLPYITPYLAPLRSLDFSSYEKQSLAVALSRPTLESLNRHRSFRTFRTRNFQLRAAEAIQEGNELKLRDPNT